MSEDYKKETIIVEGVELPVFGLTEQGHCKAMHNNLEILIPGYNAEGHDWAILTLEDQEVDEEIVEEIVAGTIGVLVSSRDQQTVLARVMFADVGDERGLGINLITEVSC